MTRQPDIVLLVLDTQRADRLSCYGHAVETTPHLDALAQRATRFTNAIAAAQWTIPSHSSMFTGLYPTAHTTVQSFSRLPHDLPTIAQRLHAGGYMTSAFCNNPLVGVVDNGLRRGFQSFLNYGGLLTSRPNQAAQGSSVVDRYRQHFKRLLVAILGRIQDSFARSDALLAFSFTPFMVPLWQTALSFKGNTTKALNDAARLLINRPGLHNDQPVFTFINLMGTHMPYHPGHEAMQRFAPEVLGSRAMRRFVNRFNSDIYGWLAPLAGDIDAERKAAIDGMYNAEVYTQDAQVGRFIEHLRASGRLDNTLLIVVADHGDHLGERQLVGHLFSLYNELVHVPLLVHDPRGDFAPGTTVERFVSTRRLFHSMLTAAGVAAPDEEALSLAQSPAADPEQGTVFAAGVPPENVVNLLNRRHPQLVQTHNCDQTRHAVWNADYKLIKTGDRRLELYRVLDDPREQHDLFASAPDQTRQLFDQLQAFVTAAPVAAPAEEIAPIEDEALRRRLRDLGYLD